MQDLPNKKCEGYDRVPVCMLHDSCELLLDPLSSLFSKIYATGHIPKQWKVSKIIPIFKKGNKNEIENHRPIANLCAASKFFEKLILTQIHYLESTNKLDLTGKQQHGFKKNKSTSTVGPLLQSMIAHAADDYCFVVRFKDTIKQWLSWYIVPRDSPSKYYCIYEQNANVLS